MVFIANFGDFRLNLPSALELGLYGQNEVFEQIQWIAAKP